MSQQFYSRYVPPTTSKRPSPVAGGRPEKRRRTLEQDGASKEKAIDSTGANKASHDDTFIHENSAPASTGLQEELQRKEKKSKNKKGHQATTSEEHDVGKVESDSGLTSTKHSSIRTKFQRSEKVSRLAERLKPQTEETSQEKEHPSPELHGLEPLPQPEDAEVIGPPIATLPSWLTKPTRSSSTTRTAFADLPISGTTKKALAAKGFEQTFAIQSAVLPLLLPGDAKHHGDVCIASGTGTGKTLSFILPMVEALRGRPRRFLRGLVVVPTRELVQQTRAIFELCATGSGLQVASAEGSKTLAEEQQTIIETRYDSNDLQSDDRVKVSSEIDLLSLDDDDYDHKFCDPLFSSRNRATYNSKIDVLICTPGRLVDHLHTTKGFTLDKVEWFVIDEVDRLLNQSYQEWLDHVIPKLDRKQEQSPIEIESLFWRPDIQRVKKIIASATLTTDISKLVSLKLFRPTLITLEGRTALEQSQEFSLPDTLAEVAIAVKDVVDKPLYLLHLLEEAGHCKTVSTIARDFAEEETSSSGSSSSGSNTSSDSDSETDTSSSSGPSESDSDSDSDTDLSSDSDSDSSDISSSESSSLQHASQGNSASPLQDKVLRQKNDKARSVAKGAVVFTTTNENALRLARLLTIMRPAWTSRIATFTGSMSSASRRKTLTKLRKGELSVVIASNLAARGLNIDNLAEVINYDLPKSLDSYVHRVGRTARAGNRGTATTLLAHHEARWFWNEIAKSSRVYRKEKVVRAPHIQILDLYRQEYEQALAKLGDEARGKSS